VTGLLVRISDSAPQFTAEELLRHTGALQFPENTNGKLPFQQQVFVKLDFVHDPKEHVTG